MGCLHSKSATSSNPNGQSPHASSSGRLSTEEILSRIDASPGSLPATLGTATVRYGYVSQRGFYPDEPSKANQDAFYVKTGYRGREGDGLFSVFDGHGKEGDICSQFVRDRLPEQIAKDVDALGRDPTTEQVEKACLKSHVECNRAMHRSSKVDDSLSGTTSISVLWMGDRMTICNVGDSRAIVGQRKTTKEEKEETQKEKGQLRAMPLSRDQTPYRKDERERVKKCGARILSLDQIEGLEPIHENWGDVNLGEELDEGGDPPRIWSPHGEYPGTAFTRSLGDSYAEELGVFAEPEMITRTVRSNDKIIVVASDGVFEFLTNQSVVDMCAKFDDPLEACRAVVAEAYELWLQYEMRTDDITMICIFVDEGGDDADAARGKDQGIAQVEDIMLEGVKPVRRNVSKRKKKAMVSARKQADDVDFDMKQYITPKSEHEKARISEAIKAGFLFQHVTSQNRDLLYSVMEKVKVKKGDWVIRQGDEGDKYFIVDNGRFEVRILEEGVAPNSKNQGGKVVHVYESGAQGAHPSFGELALMYSTPRAASIIAQTDGQLWALHRNVFRKVLMRRSGRKELMSTLRKVEVLQSLRIEQIQQLADCMTEVSYEKGEMIIRQGEVGECFYVLSSGTCVCTVKTTMGFEKQVMTLRENDYFGERALLSKDLRAANVVATSSVKCLSVSKKDFDNVIGNLQSIIDEDSKNREARSVALSDAGPPLMHMNRHGAAQVDDISSSILSTFQGQAYTLKVFSKKKIAEHGLQRTVMAEIDLLKSLAKYKIFSECSCIAGMQSTYHDNNNLYILYHDLYCCSLGGLIDSGDLETGNESAAKHIAMCCLHSLEALHKYSVMYRFISPEALILNLEGNFMFSDFRYSKQSDEGSVTLCGSAEYFAPEVCQQQGHGLPCDYWSLGVLLYEVIFGSTPFAADTELDVIAKICRHKRGNLVLTPTGGKQGVTKKCFAFIDACLEPAQTKRMGSKGINQAKKDAWFSPSDWTKFGTKSGGGKAFREVAKKKFKELETTKDGSIQEKYSGSTDWAQGF